MVYIYQLLVSEVQLMFVLKGLLRAETQEKILIYLLAREQGYATEIAEFFDMAINPIQKQLARLEVNSVVVSTQVGKTRIYVLNPRYPFLSPLKELLKCAMGAYPSRTIQALLVTRTRPRQAGKPLRSVR